MNKTNFQPPELSDENVKNIVKIGNKLLPMLPKKDEDRDKEVKVINYLLSAKRNKIISETGKDVVNHADLWNAFANTEKKK
jgi:hypothetical protein